METKFTKGPWVAIKPDFSNGFWYIDEKSTENKCGALSVCYGENAEANAHLIAAAPEMYEMLESIQNKMAGVDEYAWLYFEVKDLLAKARGE